MKNNTFAEKFYQLQKDLNLIPEQPIFGVALQHSEYSHNDFVAVETSTKT